MSLELIVDLDIQVALVLRIGFVGKEASNHLALLDSEDLTYVEDSLFPMCVFRMWAGGKSDRLVARAEIDIEPCDQGVDEVVPVGPEGELLGECKVCCGNSVEINGEYWARIGDQGFQFDCIDQRLSKSDFLHRRIVEAINVVPDCQMLAGDQGHSEGYLHPILSSLKSPSSIPAI